MENSKDICNNPLFQKAMLNSDNLLILSLDKNGFVFFINDAGAKLLGYKPADIIGKDWFDNYLPENVKDRVYKVFKNIIKGNIRRFKIYQNPVLCKGNVIRVVHFTNSVIKDRKKIIGTLSVGIDITDYANKSEELKRLENVNEILIDAAFKLNKSNDIGKITDIVIRTAKRLTDSKYGYVGYIDEKTGDFLIPRFSKEIMKECRMKNKQVVFSEFRGLWGWSLKNRKIILSNDVSKDKRASGIPRGHIKIDKFLALPVMRGEKLIGQIAVANSSRDYNEDDIDSLSRLVNLYALAVERVNANEKLNEILKRFYISVEASGQIIYTYNLDTGAVSFEGNTEEIIGYKKGELPNTIDGVLDFIHPDDREKLKSISESARDFIDIQVRFRKKGDEFIYIHIKGFTLKDRKSGEEIRYGMISNISDRIKYETEIIKREEEIRAIFENVPLSVAVMDKFRNIIFINKSFTDTYGYDRKDIADFNNWLKRAFPFATSEDVEYYTKLVFENENEIDERNNIVIKIMGKDGKIYYARFFKKNVGKRVVLILENITEERIKQKKIDLVNQLLKANTNINREIARINEPTDIIRKVVSIFSEFVQFEYVYSFSFVEDDFRKLVKIDSKGICNPDPDIIPPCVIECVKDVEDVIIIDNMKFCQGCNYYEIRNGEKTIILPLRENNIFFGCLIFILRGERNIEEEGQRILGGISKDIALRLNNLSLQKQNEEYLNRVKSIARFPTENPNPLLRIDRNGILLYANPASEDILSLWNTAIGHRVPPILIDEIESVCSTGKGIEREYNIGDKLYYLFIVPFPESGYANIYFTDITEKKRKELALKESEERFKKLFDEAPVGYYLQDENGVFLDGNPAAERLIGYKKEELIGKNFLEVGLIPEDKLGSAYEFFKKSINFGEGGPFELEIIRRDGSRITIEISVKYIELGGKRVILGIASDITDRLRLQNEIIRTNKELEKLSAGLKEEVDRQTAESRKREKMAVMIKNIIVTATNLVSEDEIMKETAYYLSEFMDFKAYGYYLSGRNDYNVSFFTKSGLCNIDIDYQSLSDNVLRYIARNYIDAEKPLRIFGEDLNHFPEFAERFRDNCQEILLVPAVYKEVNFGFMLFFLQKGTEIDEIIMDAFEQISIQLGTILEQKRTEIAREKLSRLYESVLSSAGDGIIGADRNLSITFINDAALKILGYSDKEIMGMNIHRLLHSGVESELHSIEECPFYLSLSTVQRIEREDSVFFGAGGREIEINKIVTPIVENNAVTGIVVVFRDITAEKLKQMEINRLATALNQYPVAIGFIDKDGNIKYVNDAFARHTGISREQLSHMNIDDINKGITLTMKKNPVKDNIFRQYRFVKEVDGRCFENYESVTIAPILDGSGEVSDYVVIKEDITPHIEIQEAHKAAKEDAERASRAKTAFLATISHEMRTPLTGIKGFIEELSATDLNARQSEIIRKAKTATEHLVSIVNDVLDYSKIESGRMEIENIGFDLYNSLEKVKSIMSIKAEEKRLEFKFEIKQDIPRYLKGDSKRLEQVLINLISNAAKFTYKGGVYVTVEKAGESDRKVILCFSVRDTGIGIKEEDKIKIFAPFSQADSSISRKFGGTGLGLAISKYFVEKMGGDIWVDSEYGKGATFKFTAEFEVTTADDIEIEEKFVPLPMMLKGARVLLVEDNEFNQELISNLLKKYGAAVEYAENGQEAVDIIFSKSPDYYNFVLMDIQMPIIDGKTATKIILSKEPYKNLPIIAMTAHAFKDDVDDMLKTGMCAHIPKPFEEAYALKVMSKYYFNRTAGLNFQEENKKIELPGYLKNLSCLDVEDGVKRFSNDVLAYKKMLKKFIDKYRNITEEISHLIQENKYMEAEAIVHTIKGVSGNLSIKGLYEKSIYLDRLLKENAPHIRIEEAFRSFSIELKIATEEISRLPDDEEKVVVEIDDSVYRDNVNKLVNALEGGDADALDIFISIQGNLINEYGKDNVDKIKSLIENFEHSEALEMLKSCIKRINEEGV